MTNIQVLKHLVDFNSELIENCRVFKLINSGGICMEDQNKKKNIFIRFLEWLEKANKKAVERGLCGS
jgi:hypothetical protein